MSKIVNNVERFTRDEAYEIANKYVNSVSSFNITWDELPDTNSLWDYLDEDMTHAEIISAAKEAYKERLSEDFGDDDELLDMLMED